MENNESNVELVDEPKVEKRFGVNMDDKRQSTRAFKIGGVATAVAVAIILYLKSPEKPVRNSSGVKTPEASQISGNQNSKFEQYSSAIESDRIKGRDKKRNSNIVIRLPGLQKIDRKHTGDIPPGSMVKAVLLTGASNGPVRVEIKEPLQVQGETLVPAGATLLGTGQSGEDRLMIKFNQIVFKDGTFDNINAQAADSEDKIAGLHGSKVGSYAVKYGAAIGLNFVGGMAEGLQDHEVVNQQVVARPDMKNALLNGTSRATLELANDTMSSIKSKPPVIEVPAGKEIYVLFESIR